MVYRFSFFLADFFSGGTSAHPAGHVFCLSLKNISETMFDPLFKLWTGFRMENPASLPKVFYDMNNIYNDSQINVLGFGNVAQNLDLGIVSINQCHLVFLMIGIPVLSLGKGCFNDLFRLFFETGPDSLIFYRWPFHFLDARTDFGNQVFRIALK